MPFDPKKLEAAKKQAQKVTTKSPSRSILPFGGFVGVPSFQELPESIREPLSAVSRFAGPSVLPTVGSVAVPAAATALGGPGNIPFIPVERAAGSALGELANQALGITEPSLSNVALSAGLPLALEKAGDVARTVSRFGPTKGPETLSRLAFPAAKGKVAEFAGPASRPLFQQLKSAGVRFEMGKTTTATDDLLNDLLKPSKGAQQEARGVIRYVRGLKEKLQQSGGSLDPLEMQAELRAAGELIKRLERQGGAGLGAAKRLFSVLQDDLDTALTTQQGTHAAAKAASDTLKAARQAYKRESVIEEIGEEINDAFKLKLGQGEARQFNANRIVNALTDESDRLGKFFKQAFTPQEQKQLIGFFEFLNEIPSLKPGAGQQFASGRIARGVLMATAGGGAGFAAGGATGGGVGTAIGAGLPTAAETVKMFFQAWRIPGGKELIKGLLTNSDGAVTPRLLGVVGAFVSGQINRPAPTSPRFDPSRLRGSVTGTQPFQVQR